MKNYYTAKIPIEVTNLISLYELRNEIYKERNGVDNEKFIELADGLKKYHEPEVVLSTIETEDSFQIILTNIQETEIVLAIVFPRKLLDNLI